MIATRSNERAAAALGISVFRTKLQVFAMSSFVAGLAGCMIAYRFGSVSDASFGTIASLTALGRRLPRRHHLRERRGDGGNHGDLRCRVLRHLAGDGQSRVSGRCLIGGVLLILTAILNPEGIAGGIRAKAAERRAAKMRTERRSASTVAATAR